MSGDGLIPGRPDQYDDHGCGLPDATRKGDWMQTFTGRQYWPLDPRADEVDIRDIAHHLSMLCRYCGACERFYSVAEHSLGVLAVIERDMREQGLSIMEQSLPLAKNFRLRALLHDAPEAYCHDLIRPIKRCVEGYDRIEYANWCAILSRFQIHATDRQGRIKRADNAMLLAEQEVLMKPAPAQWSPVEVPEHMLDEARRYLRQREKGLSSRVAELEFLRVAERLGAGAN